METKIIGKWTVSSASIQQTVRKASLVGVLDAYLRKEAEKYAIENYKSLLENIQSNPSSYDTISENEREFYDMSAGLGTWIMSACISPYIPLVEWLNIDETTLDELLTAVRELNPHWFDITPEQEKKTKRKRKR